jgi:hypothetical protein
VSTSPRLTARQRTAPPIDRWSNRAHGDVSSGGVDVANPRTLAPGLETEQTRYPGDAFDSQIMRDRGPFYMRPHYQPAAESWVNWTAAGPLRPELHMRNATLREMVGNSNSRYPVVINAPTTGMHTMIPGPGAQRTVQRYVTTPQMTAARINRLAPGQYAGQTYSQTTRLQGRRG